MGSVWASRTPASSLINARAWSSSRGYAGSRLRARRRLSSIWCPSAGCSGATGEPRDSPHSCRTYGVARPAEMLVSTALGRPSLIRMRPLVQVQPGPQNRPLTSADAGRSASRGQSNWMLPVRDEVLRVIAVLSRNSGSEQPLLRTYCRGFASDGQPHCGDRTYPLFRPSVHQARR